MRIQVATWSSYETKIKFRHTQCIHTYARLHRALWTLFIKRKPSLLLAARYVLARQQMYLLDHTTHDRRKKRGIQPVEKNRELTILCYYPLRMWPSNNPHVSSWASALAFVSRSFVYDYSWVGRRALSVAPSNSELYAGLCDNTDCDLFCLVNPLSAASKQTTWRETRQFRHTTDSCWTS